VLPELLLYTPYSTFFTIGVAVAISLSTTLLNRRFMNRGQVAAWQREISKWNDERNLAKKTADKKLLAKVKKQEPRVMQLQTRMFYQSMKTFLVTFIPLIVTWQVLMGFYGNTAVARLPDGVVYGQFFDLPFFFWYIICSFLVGSVSSRIFGVGLGVGMGLRPSTAETK